MRKFGVIMLVLVLVLGCSVMEQARQDVRNETEVERAIEATLRAAYEDQDFERLRSGLAGSVVLGCPYGPPTRWTPEAFARSIRWQLAHRSEADRFSIGLNATRARGDSAESYGHHAFGDLRFRDRFRMSRVEGRWVVRSLQMSIPGNPHDRPDPEVQRRIEAARQAGDAAALVQILSGERCYRAAHEQAPQAMDAVRAELAGILGEPAIAD